MRVEFCVSCGHDASRWRIRLVMKKLYGNHVKEVTTGRHSQRTVFYPFTGIYGLHGKYGLEDFTLTIIGINDRLAKIEFDIPDLRESCKDLYECMSPTNIAYQFSNTVQEVEISLRKYITN